MSKTVWTLPVSSTALLGPGPSFEKRPRREIALRFSYELDVGERHVALAFEGVEAFKCTYLSAFRQKMLEAYDKVIDRGDTEWLLSVREAMSRREGGGDDLRHLMIFFDDGPCYEILCRTFRVEET